MEWIVIWVVLLTIQTECPDYKPSPYTGEYPSTHCAVYHCETIEKEMSKEFVTKKEAKKFIANAPERIRDGMKIKNLFVYGNPGVHKTGQQENVLKIF